MNKRTSGFTLMEIMVVVIVIAVLASVAGPMITEFTESGRISATRQGMSVLRTALQAYSQDVGAFPHKGSNRIGEVTDYNDVASIGKDFMLGTDQNNILVSFANHDDFAFIDDEDVYERRWKGPYMDGDPNDFMRDAWGNVFRYKAASSTRSVYLWSAGPDGSFSDGWGGGTAATDPLSDSYDGDDIVMSITRVRAFACQ